MTVRLSDLQAAQSAALTQAFKAQQNREAARVAAAVALYYATRVDVEDPSSVERWLDLAVPRLIEASDSGAERAAAFFETVRSLEIRADDFRATPTLGKVDPGVRKSLLTQGPYAHTNKARDIQRLDISARQQKALLVEAKQESVKAIAASAIRHAQAGGRQTLVDNSELDPVALGWVRVTKADPCFFCAMLASRGYRTFYSDSFADSDPRFTGEGDAKVHDNCGCSLKPVYSDNDPLVANTKKFADMWSMWGAGGGDAAQRFRRGYDHFQSSGEYLTWEQAGVPASQRAA